MAVEIDFKAICTLVCSFESVRNLFKTILITWMTNTILKNFLNWLFKECKGVRTPAAWKTDKPSSMRCWKLLSINQNECGTSDDNWVTFIKQGINTIKV